MMLYESFFIRLLEVERFHIKAIIADVSDGTTESYISERNVIILVHQKSDFLTLINGSNCFRNEKMILCDFTVPGPTDPVWPYFDAIKITMLKSKTLKSITFLSLEAFCGPEQSRLNILATDDGRVSQGRHIDGTKITRIHQATCLSNSLVILHEGYVSSSTLTFCKHNRGLRSAVFSSNSQLLMTGKWNYHESTVETTVKTFLGLQLTRVSGQVRTNSSREQETVEQKHRIEILDFKHHCECVPNVSENDVFFAEFANEYCHLPRVSEHLCNKLPDIDASITAMIERPFPISPSPFALMSESGFIKLQSDEGVELKVVWKRFHCKDKNQFEIKGSQYASMFYPFVQIPTEIISGELMYPFFNGESQFAKRAKYIRYGRKDTLLRDLILETEMRKAGDILNASVQSFRMDNPDPLCDGLNRLLYNRIKNENIIFQNRYQEGIKFGAQTVALSNFIRAPIIVNGIKYPSFLELTRRAELLLDPSAYQKGFIFSLGDCHGGNVLIENVDNAHLQKRNILYIDYEFAGFCPPLLDIVNPFLFDVFFDIVYTHITMESPEVEYMFERDTVIINLTLAHDILNSSILEIKIRYLMAHLLEFYNNEINLDCALIQLGYAIFASCTTKVHIPGWKELFSRMAVGVIFSDIKSLDDFYIRWNMFKRVSKS